MLGFSCWLIASKRGAILASENSLSPNHQLNKLVNCESESNVPAVFIDSHFEQEDSDDDEAEKFDDQMTNLEQYLMAFTCYSCEGFEAVKIQLDDIKEEKEKLEIIIQALKNDFETSQKEAMAEKEALEKKLEDEAQAAKAEKKVLEKNWMKRQRLQGH